jgi:beta-glucanase (GH16 family)
VLLRRASGTRTRVRAVLLTAVVLAVVAVVVLLTTGTHGRPGATDTDVTWPEEPLFLEWSDEFTGPAGAPPDQTRWIVETGAEWTENEMQCYTADTANARQDGNGNLVIRALHRPGHRCADGLVRDYTSARITTRHHAGSGVLAVRARLPTGRGTWPAIWALGSNYSEVGWPACGEMDLVEATGVDPHAVGVHIHGPGYSHADALGTTHRLEVAASSYHVYAVRWDDQRVEFSIDGRPVWGTSRDALPAGATWALDHSFFAILNVAVGGTLAGPPDDSTTWPQQMTVDYVRFYGHSQGHGTSPAPTAP